MFFLLPSPLNLLYYPDHLYADSPNITINPSNDSILTNRTYTLVCEVTGAPFPDITWYKDGETIDYSNRLYLNLFDGSLHFSQTILQDEGVYQCEAKNEYGTVTSTEAILSITGMDYAVVCFTHYLLWNSVHTKYLLKSVRIHDDLKIRI